MTDRDEIALRLFCALLGKENSIIDLYPGLGEKQIRICFLLADNFQRIAAEGAASVNVHSIRGTSDTDVAIA